MTEYRRALHAGGTFFFTVVTHRRPILASPEAIDNLRSAVACVKKAKPFRIDAIAVLPDHIHAIWTLPVDDDDF